MKTYVCLSQVYTQDKLFVIGDKVQLDEATALILAESLKLDKEEIVTKPAKQLRK